MKKVEYRVEHRVSEKGSYFLVKKFVPSMIPFLSYWQYQCGAERYRSMKEAQDTIAYLRDLHREFEEGVYEYTEDGKYIGYHKEGDIYSNVEDR